MAAGTPPRSGLRKAVLAALLLAALGVTGAVVKLQWFDWFTRPALWREVQAARQTWPGEEERLAYQAPLRRLLEAQGALPAATEGAELWLHKARAPDGDDVWLVCLREEPSDQLEEDTFAFVPIRTAHWKLGLLDARGRCLRRGEGGWIEASEEFDPQLQVTGGIGSAPDPELLAKGWLECSFFAYRIERSGLVPRGTIVGLHDADGSPLVPVSRNVSRWARHHDSRDARPLPDLGAVKKRLTDPRPHELFRALAEVERLDSSWAHLAVPLLKHSNPELRARAAAIAGNDVEQAPALAPLLSDPAPEARRAAAYALLNTRDLRHAREAVALILEERPADLLDYALDVPLAELASSGTDQGRLLSVIESRLTAFLTSSTASDHDLDSLRPPVDWLARLETASADRWLLQTLEKVAGEGTETEMARLIVEALLARRTPLRCEGGVAAIQKLEPFEVERALLLAWWGEPGAVDGLEELVAGRLDLLGSEALFEHFPPHALPRLVERSLEREAFVLDPSVWKILARQAPEQLRRIQPKVLALWHRATAVGLAPSYSAAALLKLEDPEVDGWIAAWLEAPEGSPSLDEDVLRALLDRSTPLKAPQAVKLLEALARGEAEPSGEGTISVSTFIIELGPVDGTSSEAVFHADLAAHLILARWNAPGAAGRLLKRFKDPEHNWLNTELVQEYLPRELLPGLEEIAKARPGPFAARVRVLGGKRWR